MNYIVMDLEWNQSAKGKQFSEDHFPFEIIQDVYKRQIQTR